MEEYKNLIFKDALDNLSKPVDMSKDLPDNLKRFFSGKPLSEFKFGHFLVKGVCSDDSPLTPQSLTSLPKEFFIPFFDNQNNYIQEPNFSFVSSDLICLDIYDNQTLYKGNIYLIYYKDVKEWNYFLSVQH